MVWSKQQFDVLIRAIAEETRMRNLEIRFEFIEDEIKTVFPAEVVTSLLNLFNLNEEEQVNALCLLHPQTLKILSELETI